MHKQVEQFVIDAWTKFNGGFVQIMAGCDHKYEGLDIGSYNINGSVRDLGLPVSWTGIDWRAGEGVDVVTLAHEYQTDKRFDIITCCEMLEHDLFANWTIRKMFELVALRGLIVITCATVGRAAHEMDCGVNSYYLNVIPYDLIKIINEASHRIASMYVEVDDEAHDLRCWVRVK